MKQGREKRDFFSVTQPLALSLRVEFPVCGEGSAAGAGLELEDTTGLESGRSSQSDTLKAQRQDCTLDLRTELADGSSRLGRYSAVGRSVIIG